MSCLAVWGVILAVGRRRLDPVDWERLRLVSGGWWIGWASATIARAGFPPPRPLGPAGQKRLANVSFVLVVLGLGNTIRFLATGGRSANR